MDSSLLFEQLEWAFNQDFVGEDDHIPKPPVKETKAAKTYSQYTGSSHK